jgi:putative transposase
MISTIEASLASDTGSVATPASSAAEQTAGQALSISEANPSALGVLSVSSACQTLSIARSTFYRYRSLEPELEVEPDVELRSRIQMVALEWPSYGYRRITAELQRQGMRVNRKAVLRLMRQDNLLCLRRRRFRMATTDSNHGMPVYPNLAKGKILTGCGQLSVSDITYIRLGREFIYLAVVLDAHSRKIVGWELSRRIDAALALDALDSALAQKPQDTQEKRDPLIHHSDRGSQYASSDYIQRLRDHDIAISMSRKGTPQDNAFAESFLKTLKYEEVYMTEYANIREAKAQIGHFLEEVYKKKRLHSALGYMPPAEFEIVSRQKLRTTP